ncbi:hypothetical protein [Microvirga antarctica]|uniref:hypothetical protein n=1 Tax=Microvirga antarctica TaxID=2819233 RepID=UPI001B3051DA|nr:hypothetical protein [Microvirga antarctica]
MIDVKPLLASRTIWSNLIGLAALVLGLRGYDASALTDGVVLDAIAQLVAAVSFIASSVFRVVATKQILK